MCSVWLQINWHPNSNIVGAIALNSHFSARASGQRCCIMMDLLNDCAAVDVVVVAAALCGRALSERVVLWLKVDWLASKQKSSHISAVCTDEPAARSMLILRPLLLPFKHTLKRTMHAGVHTNSNTRRTHIVQRLRSASAACRSHNKRTRCEPCRRRVSEARAKKCRTLYSTALKPHTYTCLQAHSPRVVCIYSK